MIWSSSCTRPRLHAELHAELPGWGSEAPGTAMAAEQLRAVFLAPSWGDQLSHDRTGDSVANVDSRAFDAAARLWEPEDEPGATHRARTAQRLAGFQAYAPPKALAATHWARRPAPPGPPASLTRSVQPHDLLAWADASAARGAGHATTGDWRGAFRSYVVAAELLGQLLGGDEPSQELRERARRRMDVVVGIAEELREANPQLLLFAPSAPSPAVAVARAWGKLDEAITGAQATLSREENRAGNAQFKAGKPADAVARYSAALELDATQPYVYGNRSVAFLRIDDLGAALRDAHAAVDLEPEAVARREGVPLRRRGADAAGAPADPEGEGGEAEGSMAEAQRSFMQEVAKEVAELRACSIDAATVQLLECAELGDTEGLMRALGEGANINRGHPGWLDYTALHMASLHGHLDIARLLLNAGANISVLARDGARPLHIAASPAMAVLLAEQPYVDREAKDRDGLSAVQRLVEEQGWASEMLYEEGDILVLRPTGPADIAANEIGREAAATGVNVHSTNSCLGASIDPRHFRLCLVCERVRRHGGDGNQLFLGRWYNARSSGGSAKAKADLQTIFVLDDNPVLIDRSDVFRRLRSGAAGCGSLVVRGVTLKGRGGQDGRVAAMMAGTALHSAVSTMPTELVLEEREWINVVR